MPNASAAEQYMLELINAERALVGVQPLAFDDDLNESSESHSNWMLATDIFSHTGINGSDAGERMASAGYNFSGNWTWGENIAWRSTQGTVNIQDEVQQLHTSLMNSPGHRANLLRDDFREIGVGVETGRFENFDAAIVTQNFARTASEFFLTGVAFNDLDGDLQYDIGEGFDNVTVIARNNDTNATATTTANAGGGYNLELTNGNYTVSFSGNGFATTELQTSINNQNMKLDLINPNAGDTTTPDPQSNTISGTADPDTLNGTSGNDHIMGNDGDDLLHSSAGNDVIDGGNGIDIMHYTGLYSNYSIHKENNNFIVTEGNDSDIVSNIERINFADTQLAIDLDGHAGTTSKILGAIFGTASLSNKAFVGIGLELLDNGMNDPDLVQLALDVKLGTGFSNADEVNLLYENLTGSLPDANALNFWTGKLEDGTFTQNTLAIMAVNSDLNADNIDLVGLSQTGIEFM